MSTKPGFQDARWASGASIAGGLLMVLLWLVFTSVHGPTSFNQDGIVLGRSMLFWGSMLGGPPNLLVALGLMLLFPRFVPGASRLARAGYAFAVLGLVVTACVDLFIWGALGPPLFLPIVGVGLIIMAAASWQNPRFHQPSLYILLLIGGFQLLAFGFALIPLDISDRIGGYRIYGVFAHVVAGIGWVGFGGSLQRGYAVRRVV